MDSSRNDSDFSRQRPPSIFERHPKTTLVVLFILGFFLLDILVGNVLMLTGVWDPPQKHESRYRVAHPVYHHGFVAGLSGYDARFGPLRHQIRTNSLGFKDRAAREISLQAPGRRIVLIGDSFTEGIGVEYENTFVGYLESDLASRGIEVLGAGVSSYSPIIYWRKIKFLIGQGFTFDDLIVFIDVSDAANEYKHYTLDEEQNVVDRNLFGAGDRFRDWLTDNTIFYANVRTWMREAKQRRKAGELEQKSGFAIDHKRSNWTLQEELYASWGREGLETGARHMDALLELSREKGFGLSVVVYPWPDQIWYDDLDSVQARFWSEWARDRNVPFKNFFPVFVGTDRTAKEVLTEYFLEGDVHWNAAGHRMIADGILTQLPQLAPRAAGGVVESGN